jgi:hypothetical protein
MESPAQRGNGNYAYIAIYNVFETYTIIANSAEL